VDDRGATRSGANGWTEDGTTAGKKRSGTVIPGRGATMLGSGRTKGEEENRDNLETGEEEGGTMVFP